MVERMLGWDLADRSTKWWTEELTIEIRGVVWKVWAEERSLGRSRRARRKVEITLTVIVDLGGWVRGCIQFEDFEIGTYSLSSAISNSCTDIPAFSIRASSLSSPSARCANALTDP